MRIFGTARKILERVRGTWSVPGNKRHGNIDLRRISISPRMLDALRLDDLDICMSLSTPNLTTLPSSTASSSETRPQIERVSHARFRVPTSAFLDLTTTLTSRLTHPIYPLLRLQPALRTQPYNVALDLGRKLAFNGTLQRALPRLSPGQSSTVTVGMVFLAAGEYEIGACVEEVRPWRPSLPQAADGKPSEDDGTVAAATKQARSRAETGDFGLIEPERTRRRAWYARDACLVDARIHEAVG